MTTVLQCIVQALLESIQFLYKCCHLDNKAALLKRAGFILILALLNGEYTLAGEQWTKKRVTNLSWQLHAKEEKMHYDSVVCSAPSQDHCQTKMAFLHPKAESSFQILHVYLPTPTPIQWDPPLQLHSLDKGEKKEAPTFPLPCLSSCPHPSPLLFRASSAIFVFKAHQLDYCIVLGKKNICPLFDLHYLLLSETELLNSWDFLKFSLLQEALPWPWLLQGMGVAWLTLVPKSSGDTSWNSPRDVFWCTMTYSCKNIC